MASEDGEVFIKNLAQFVRTHEKALANALQLRRQASRPALKSVGSEVSPTQTGSLQASTASSAASALAAAFSLGGLSFTSHSIKPAKLTLTPHHLFYLLSRFEELGITVGSMNVRLENLHAEASPANYVSFLSKPSKSHGRSDKDSIHSVSSVRSVMSSVSSLWANIGMNSSRIASKTEKAQLQLQTDLKYLYSAFTKIPCLRLSPDRKARLISGYEEFPFDTAVPLIPFKNVSALEIFDLDFRQFYGWDKLSEQLRSLTVKRAHVEDPLDLLVGIVLDDMDKRRRRSSKVQTSPTPPWPASPSIRHVEFSRSYSSPGSPAMDDRWAKSSSPRNSLYMREAEVEIARSKGRERSLSPTRLSTSHRSASHRYPRPGSSGLIRSGSESSTSSSRSIRGHSRNRSSSNILAIGILPTSKWRFLRHLSLADNALTSISETSLLPLANCLHSLDLSSNLFTEVPDCLANLTALRALNLSDCMIESLHSLARNPLPAINSLNLRSNRLRSIAGIERLLSLERLDLRDNRLADPIEMARLTGIPGMHELWVSGNPFVRSHGNYRVTILNLFRSTPGYTDDVVVDAISSGFSERRQLKERIAEEEGVQVVKPAPPEPPIIEQSRPPPSTLRALQVVHADRQRPSPSTTQSDVVGSLGSGRRKTTRRRIVDLSVEDIANPTSSTVVPVPLKKLQVAFADPTSASFPSPDPFTSDGLDAFAEAAAIRPTTTPLPVQEDILPTPIIPTTTPASSTDSTLPRASANLLIDQLHGLDLNGDAYRRKVEALKNEFGTGWLKMLTEESWPPGSGLKAMASDVDFVRYQRPSDMSSLRSPGPAIVGGSRTLG